MRKLKPVSCALPETVRVFWNQRPYRNESTNLQAHPPQPDNENSLPKGEKKSEGVRNHSGFRKHKFMQQTQGGNVPLPFAILR